MPTQRNGRQHSSVFVSHSHTDNVFCRRLVRDIRSLGLSVWYDEDDLTEGWLLSVISNALEQHDIFIPIVSPAFLSAQWALVEVNIAFTLQTSSQIKIIPVIAPETSLPPSWVRALRYYDFAHNRYEDAFIGLSRALLSEERSCNLLLPDLVLPPNNNTTNSELAKKLASVDARMRLEGIRGLAEQGDIPACAVPVLEAVMFGDPDRTVRRTAALAFSGLLRHQA